MTPRKARREALENPANNLLWATYKAFLETTGDRPNIAALGRSFGMTKGQALGAVWRRRTGCY